MKVFETFGGDLPVFASQPKAVTQNGRATGPDKRAAGCLFL
ncbi:hypothetical protein [Paenibacillus sp. sgz302251]